MVDLDVGNVFAGYRIDGVAGEGGMGVVYRATHLTLEIPVAVKVIRSELAKDAAFRERFKRESRLAASIEHPNVLPVHHAGEEEGRLYITMRYVEGTDLRALIDADGRLEPRAAVDLLSQVAAALDAAHARGLVHRDVKPANVLIERRTGDDHAFLTDFGLTRQASSQSGLTRTGQWVGTLDYVAPEQIEGKKVDARSDVYALGCMFYEMLTGEVPFMRESEVATMYAHLNEDPPALLERGPASPAALDAVITRAMAKNPDERYQTAGEFGQAAREALSEGRGKTAISAPKGETMVSPQPVSTSAPASTPDPQRTSLSGTEISSRPSLPTRAGSGAPAPSLPSRPSASPAAAGPRGRRRGLWFAVGGLVLVAIVAGVLLVTGVFGGGKDSGGESVDPAAQREANARAVVTEFTQAFKREGQAGIEALLAPEAKYLYPGYAPSNPANEYRDLFATEQVRDYRLDVTDVQPIGESVQVMGIYEYKNGGSSPASGALTLTLSPDPTSGTMEITEVKPVPDLYVLFDNTDPPTSVDVTVKIGSREVAKEHFQLAQTADNIPLRLPVEPDAETAFNSQVEFQATIDYKDTKGPGQDRLRLGYPFAS